MPYVAVAALLVVSLFFGGCGAAPPADVPRVAAAASPSPWPTDPLPPASPPAAPTGSSGTISDLGAAGTVAGQPFFVRNATLWEDAGRAWISFDPVVPMAQGRYDPLARRAPRTAFIVYLDAQKLQPGTYKARARALPSGSPITGAVLQIVNTQSKEIKLVDVGWTVTLVIDDVAERKTDVTGLHGLNVRGHISLRFENPDAWLVGAFIAHDTLRGDQVSGPSVSIPTPPTSPDKTE